VYFDFPASYSAAFCLAFLLQMISWWIQREVSEVESPVSRPVRPLRMLYGDLKEILSKDPRFRSFLIASAFSSLGLLPAGFFMVAAIKRIGLPDSSIGVLTSITIGSQVLSAGVLGWIADRRGFKTSLLICSMSMTGASVVALFAESIWSFALVFMLMGVTVGAELLTRFNFAADCAPEAKRPTYIGLMNAWIGPFYVASVFGGGIAEAFGYGAVFVIGIGFSLAGFLLLLRVDEPRSIRTVA
jgi:MFS family permease